MFNDYPVAWSTLEDILVEAGEHLTLYEYVDMVMKQSGQRIEFEDSSLLIVNYTLKNV